jgi:hypothetical protein
MPALLLIPLWLPFKGKSPKVECIWGSRTMPWPAVQMGYIHNPRDSPMPWATGTPKSDKSPGSPVLWKVRWDGGRGKETQGFCSPLTQTHTVRVLGTQQVPWFGKP